MNEIIQIDSVQKYNDIRGAETLHPMVSVLDYKNLKMIEDVNYNFGLYAVFLKETICGDLMYGKQTYDYQEESLVFVSPGQVLSVGKYDETKLPKGKVLLFDPEFLHGTELSKNFPQYTFFNYDMNEALHLSTRERNIVLDLYDKIEFELQQNIDKHSKTLILDTIQLILNYSLRFYDRQFITREKVNQGVLTRFESQLNKYFREGRCEQLGLPTVAYFANQLYLSANYFGDLVKKHTGKSAQDYIQNKLVETAKNQLFDEKKTVSEIAYELGFKYPSHFSRMFKKATGQTPGEYRTAG